MNIEQYLIKKYDISEKTSNSVSIYVRNFFKGRDNAADVTTALTAIAIVMLDYNWYDFDGVDKICQLFYTYRAWNWKKH